MLRLSGGKSISSENTWKIRVGRNVTQWEGVHAHFSGLWVGCKKT